ncbi:hypothetical protein GW17_00019939 [Ensete ventricosum]|nr:hypothetical protein GW17_00019939 [Ensete ventricosum]
MLSYCCYLGGMDEGREGVALVVGGDDDLVQSHSVQVRPRDKVVEGRNMGTVMPSPVTLQRLAAHVWLQRALCPPSQDEKRMCRTDRGGGGFSSNWAAIRAHRGRRRPPSLCHENCKGQNKKKKGGGSLRYSVVGDEEGVANLNLRPPE